MPKSWINHIQNIQQEPLTTSRMDRTDNEGPDAPKETQHVLHRRVKLQKLPMKTILLKQRDLKNLLCHQHKSRPKELPLGTRKKKITKTKQHTFDPVAIHGKRLPMATFVYR